MVLQNFIAGLLLGLGLIIAIGAQNVFVLQQGLRRSHVFAVCLTCALSDALLITIGVGGFQLVAAQAAWVEPVLTIGGALFLFVYGAMSARRAIWPQSEISVGEGKRQPLFAVLMTCLALTFLNPHVYLDTVVLMGAVSTQYDPRIAFGAGAVVASFLWFFSLGYGAGKISHLFENPRTWRFLDSFVALVMWSIAAKLLFF